VTDQPVQAIQLDADDDVAIVRDRLEWAAADTILLVVPFRNRALRNLVNLKLLARHAHNSGRRIALITTNPRVVDLSREAGLTTFSSLERAEDSAWLRSAVASAPAAARPTADQDVPAADAARVPGVELPHRPHQKTSRPKHLPVFQPRSRRRPTRFEALTRRLFSAIGFLVILAVLAAMLGVVLLLLYPEGHVHLTAKRMPVQAEVSLQASPKVEKVDYQAYQVPARLAQVELRNTTTMAPTGASDMPTDRATGAVTFINRTNQEVTVPISTTVSTSSGTTVRFATALALTVPASLNATGSITVTAIEPGPIGNVRAGQINRIENLVLARQLAVINETPTSGGKAAAAGVVTREDKDRLWAIVLQKMYTEGYAQLKAELGEQEFIPPEAVVVLPLEGAFMPSMDGEQTDQLLLEMRAVVRGVVVGGQNANQLALAALQAATPPGYKLDPRSLQFIMGDVLGVADDQTVTFEMRAAGEAVAQIDTATVSSDVRGLPAEQARSLLSQQLPLAAQPRVSVEPDWLGTLPWLPFRINVTVTE
jgi:hypothetical protein